MLVSCVHQVCSLHTKSPNSQMCATLMLSSRLCPLLSAHLLIVAAARRVPYTRTLRVKQCVFCEPHEINKVSVTDRSTAQVSGAAMR